MRGSDPMPDAHRLDVGAEVLRQIGQFVHEADFGGQHGVGGVLGELRRAHVHDDHAVAIMGEGLIQGSQQLRGALGVGADDDPVRLHEVIDGRPLLQEFRVRDHVELDRRIARLRGIRPHRLSHLIRGTHRHRGFGDHHLVFAHVLADGAGHRQHIAQVRRAVLIGRRAHRDQLEQPVLAPPPWRWW